MAEGNEPRPIADQDVTNWNSLVTRFPNNTPTDLNSLIKGIPTIVRYNGETLNSPYKEGVTAGVFGFVISMETNDNYGTQLGVPMGGAQLFMRARIPSGWTSWSRVI